MAELKRTTNYGKGKASHYHVVYLREQDGLTSTDKNHSHPVTLQEEKVMQMMPHPEIMGMEVPIEVPTGNTYFIVQPSEDGHTHEIIDLEPAIEKKSKETDEDKVKEVMDLFKFVKEYESDSRKKAEESEKFKKNEQWKPGIKAELEGDNRAALTFNDTEASLDVLCGYQMQNRTEFKAFPIEDGDSRAADILNTVVKSIEIQNEFPFRESQVFDSMSGLGRGFFQVYKDYSKDLRGEIFIRRFPWRDAYLGPHEEPDGSDCEYLFKAKWYSMSKIKAEHPDKASKISAEFDILQDNVNEPHEQHAVGQYEKSTNSVPTADPDLIDVAQKNYRKLELWRKQFKKTPVIVQAEDDFYFNADGMDKKDLASVKTIEGITVVDKLSTSMRITTTITETLIDDIYTEDEDFDIFPCYAKKIGKDWWGKWEAAKDATREQNKRLSQISDILNKAIYGWFVDANTFPSHKDIEKFKTDSTKQGFVIEVSNVNNVPVKTEGTKFPAELARYCEMMNAKRREILNINAELLGANTRTESGVAQIEKKKQALIGNEYLFDNLRFTKKRVFKRVVRLIQEIYPPERILRIIENQNNMKPIKVGGQPLFPAMPQQQMGQGGMANPMADPNQMAMMQQQQMEMRRQEILDILRNTDLTKFDIAIDESPESPTKRQANFAEWQRAAASGSPVPPTMLYELSDLPDKERWIEEVKNMLSEQKDMEMKKMQNEIQKTMIPAMAKQQEGTA